MNTSNNKPPRDLYKLLQLEEIFHLVPMPKTRAQLGMAAGFLGLIAAMTLLGGQLNGFIPVPPPTTQEVEAAKAFRSIGDGLCWQILKPAAHPGKIFYRDLKWVSRKVFGISAENLPARSDQINAACGDVKMDFKL